MDKETLKKAYKNAPPKLQRYIDSDEWDRGGLALGKAAGVSSERLDDLTDEILLTLLGLEEVTTFKNRLKDSVGLDSDKSRQLDQNVYGSIFKNLLSEINEARHNNKESQEDEVLELGDLPPEYEEQYNKLPDDVKQAISSVDSAKRLEAIVTKNKLHIDQAGDLGTQTGLVMLGVLAPRDFVKAISEKLNVSLATAQAIAADVNAQIFTPIRESLKQVHHLEFNKEPAPPIKTEPVVTPSPFLSKIQETTASPTEKAEVKPTPTPDKPKKEFDPYRESIE